MIKHSYGLSENKLPLNGAFLIDKPTDFTSSDVVSKLKRPLTENAYAARGFKIGHGGTLDPFATGVLVVLLGEATKLADSYLHSIKAYEGIIQLGARTDTADLSGKVIEQKPIQPVSTQQWQEFTRYFTQNPYFQIPPMYSAKKKAGKPLHELARLGIEVERKGILKKITQFEIIPRNEDQLFFKLECESGTYVRVLAEDLAALSDQCAHLIQLRRTRSSDVKLEQTQNLQELLQLIESQTPLDEIPAFRPLSKVASHLKSLTIEETTSKFFREGNVPYIQNYCQAALHHYPLEHYVVIRALNTDVPVALLEKSPNAAHFRLQRVFR